MAKSVTSVAARIITDFQHVLLQLHGENVAVITSTKYFAYEIHLVVFFVRAYPFKYKIVILCFLYFDFI